MFENQGIDLSGSLLASWVGKSTKYSTADAIRDLFAAQDFRTTSSCCKRAKVRAQHPKTARLWVYADHGKPGADRTTRPGISCRQPGGGASQQTSGNAGAHADAYAGYNDAYRTGRVTEMACMAHVRREFTKVYERPLNRPQPGKPAIAELYEVEKFKSPRQRVANDGIPDL